MKKILPNFFFFRPSYYFTKESAKLFTRSVFLTKDYVGQRISVYNGRVFRPILIRDYHVAQILSLYIITKMSGTQIHQRKKKRLQNIKFLKL